jgi:hypothetical protein
MTVQQVQQWPLLLSLQLKSQQQYLLLKVQQMQQQGFLPSLLLTPHHQKLLQSQQQQQQPQLGEVRSHQRQLGQVKRQPQLLPSQLWKFQLLLQSLLTLQQQQQQPPLQQQQQQSLPSSWAAPSAGTGQAAARSAYAGHSKAARAAQPSGGPAVLTSAQMLRCPLQHQQQQQGLGLLQ